MQPITLLTIALQGILFPTIKIVITPGDGITLGDIITLLNITRPLSIAPIAVRNWKPMYVEIKCH